MINYGKNIQRERLAKGLTQDQLADRLGTSRRMVGKYETGKTKPSLPKLEAIAEALQIPLSRLYQE